MIRAGALAGLLAWLLSSTLAIAQTVVIENVHVAPMDREATLRDHAVLIDGQRITAVVPMAGYEPPEGAKRIDGGGGYLVPGLVDTHVHLEEYMDTRAEFGDAPVFLRHGITAVFNLRGFPEHLALRERINDGELLAPTLYTSGEFVNEPRVNNPEEAAAEVHAQAAAGVDMIKVREVVEHGVGVLTTRGMDRETFFAVHETARQLGMPVLGHAPHGLKLEAVLRTGHSFAHAGELVQFHFFPRQPPLGWRIFQLAIATLAVVLVGGLSWRLLSRVPPVPGAWELKGASALMLLIAGGALALMFMLLPGGLHYGNTPLILLMGLHLGALVGIGIYFAWRVFHPRAGEGIAMQFGLGLLALCGLAAGSFGLAQGVPVALRATAAEMEQVAEQLAESGAWLGTTLVIYDELLTLRRTGGPTRVSPDIAAVLTPEFRQRYQDARAWLSQRRWSDYLSIEGLVPRYHDFTRELTGALHRAGVPLLAGTDAFGIVLAPPGETMPAELELLVEAGLSPYEALKSATVEPARFLRREDEFGMIVPGQRADFLLLDEDPLADISAIRKIEGVMLRGRWLPLETLEEMLAALR